MALLVGVSIKPRTISQARALIGKRVEYLCRCDIDRSGRGYYFPRRGVVAAAIGKNIAIDEPNNFCIYLPELVEMVEVE